MNKTEPLLGTQAPAPAHRGLSLAALQGYRPLGWPSSLFDLGAKQAAWHPGLLSLGIRP